MALTTEDIHSAEYKHTHHTYTITNTHIHISIYTHRYSHTHIYTCVHAPRHTLWHFRKDGKALVIPG